MRHYESLKFFRVFTFMDFANESSWRCVSKESNGKMLRDKEQFDAMKSIGKLPLCEIGSLLSIFFTLMMALGMIMQIIGWETSQQSESQLLSLLVSFFHSP